MIIIVPFDRGFTIRPIIAIPKRVANDPAYKAAYIAHEQTHYDRQKSFFGALVWIAKYFTDKQFRLDEEAKAYVNEILSFRNAGYNPTIDGFAKMLSEQYWGCCDFATARGKLIAGLTARE